MIQANQIDFYYLKLRKAIKTSFSIKNIITHHFSDLSINTNDYICQFNHFLLLDNLQLTVIRDMHDQIVTNYPSYQKTVSFITQNDY